MMKIVCSVRSVCISWYEIFACVSEIALRIMLCRLRNRKISFFYNLVVVKARIRIVQAILIP